MGRCIIDNITGTVEVGGKVLSFSLERADRGYEIRFDSFKGGESVCWATSLGLAIERFAELMKEELL